MQPLGNVLGIERFGKARYDCVITDLAMPGLDGLGVLKQVKAKEPGTRVLVITGNSTVDLLASAVNNGADAYITKPFKVREIDQQLNRLGVDGDRTHNPGVEGDETRAEQSFGQIFSVPISLGWGLLAMVAVSIIINLLLRLV